MPKVVVKGESIYKCSVCSRSVRVPTNKHGLDVLQRCIITHNCQGKLNRVTIAKEINETPAFPPEVQGVADWFQRRVLYTHEQPVQSLTWLIRHDLATRPKIYVYVNRLIDGEEILVKVDPKTETTIDLNTVEVTFEGAESGLVQCISLASQNSTNPTALSGLTVSTDAFQLTSDVGEVTIATLSSAPLVGIGLTYRTSGTEIDITIDYAGIDAVPSIGSPWVGSSRAVINGQVYTLRSFNLTQTPLAPTYFAAGAVPNGSTFYVSTFSNAPPSLGQCLFLLGRAPYATVDRIFDQYIDAATISPISPELFYNTGKGYATRSVIRSTYPPVLIVE
jgi:hypothetical protein